MKRRINLLSINFTKRELSEVVTGFRMKALVLLGILIVIVIGEYAVYGYIENKAKQFVISKTTLSQYLDTNEDFDKKLKYFFYKYNLFTSYIEEDANGYEYYIKVRDLIAQTAPTSKITTFSYKNNGETTFSLAFANFQEASAFISLLETPVFLDVFQFIQLEGFEAMEKEDKISDFTITIFAQFIPENEV